MPVLNIEKTVTSVDKHPEELEPSHIAGLNVNSKVTMAENSVAVPQKVKQRISCDPVNPLLGICLRQ